MRKKTYNQFIEEAVSLQELVPLAIPPAIGLGAKAAGALLTAWSAYEAAKKIKKGDYKGAALDAATAIPVGGPAFKAAKFVGAGKNLARAASATAATSKYAGAAALRDEEPAQSNGQDTTPKPQATGSSGSEQKPIRNRRGRVISRPTSTSTPTSSTPTSSTPTSSTPQSSSVVLARKGGVEGSLDKSTGKFTASKWSSAESDRYARYGGKPTPTPTPTPTTASTPSSDSRTKNILDRMKAKRNSGNPTSLTTASTPASTPTSSKPRVPNLPNLR
jgi:hypothetical protein